MVSKITKNINKESEQLVHDKIEIEHELTQKSEQELDSISEVVSKELRKRARADKIDNYLDKGLGLAAKKAIFLIKDEDAMMSDIVGFGKFQLDARKGLGTLKEDIGNTQNDNDKPREFTVNFNTVDASKS